MGLERDSAQCVLCTLVIANWAHAMPRAHRAQLVASPLVSGLSLGFKQGGEAYSVGRLDVESLRLQRFLKLC